jgi:hypothetical protein
MRTVKPRRVTVRVDMELETVAFVESMAVAKMTLGWDPCRLHHSLARRVTAVDEHFTLPGGAALWLPAATVLYNRCYRFLPTSQ